MKEYIIEAECSACEREYDRLRSWVGDDGQLQIDQKQIGWRLSFVAGNKPFVSFVAPTEPTIRVGDRVTIHVVPAS